MLKTAPPETIEQAHAEAFARLSPQQRRQLLVALANAAPPSERAAAEDISPDDPRAMGRLATRTELRQPGFMERTLGVGGGAGLGGSLLGSFAMGFLASMAAHSFFSALGGFGDAPGEAATGTTDADVDQTEADMNADDMDASDLDAGDLDIGGGDFDV